MPSDCISYRETNYFSGLILDYLAQDDKLKPFFNRFPALDEFQGQMEEKKKGFSSEIRGILRSSLESQYQGLRISDATRSNLALLSGENTFTITTGHQLNLFTGPLYFLYKIISAINLSSELKQKYPESSFIPVYWMATEDHDFEEINYFNLHGKKFQWNPPKGNKTGGAVGEYPTEGLEEVFALLSSELGAGKNAETLKNLFQEAYLRHSNLTQATRYLANELFGGYGLVIVDGHDKELKRVFCPYMERELLERISYETVLPKAEALLEAGYPVQVNPREINLFYLSEGLRERIIQEEGRYYVHNTEINWNREGLLELLWEHPEKFSPNVLMRPLYQEVILPNLCYIGGGGELAYWLQLRDYFEAVGVTFPILLLRNSALIQSQKQAEKRDRLNISTKDLFLKQHELINRKVRQISNVDIDFSPQKRHLELQFQELYDLAEKTDRSFLNAVKAQEIKQKKGLEHLEKRLLKAQKRKLEEEVTRITDLQNQLFPNKGLQERQSNFSECFLDYGQELITVLVEELQPLQQQFKVITL